MRTFNLIKMGLAGVLSVGVIAACSDRFGDMKARKYSQEDYLKARKMTVEQYNDWARANNKPLIATRPSGVGPDKGGQPTPPNLKPTTPDTLPGTDKPGTGTPGDKPGTGTPGDKPGTGTPGDKPGTGTPGDKPGTGTPGDKPGTGTPENCGTAPDVNAPYSRAFWSCEFQRLMKAGENDSLSQVIEGLSIGSGVDPNTKSAIYSIQAVVHFGGDLRILTTEQLPVAFDANEVQKVKIELRQKAGGPVDTRLTDEIFVSASCLSNESPCREFGVIIDFKVQDGRLLAVFQVQTGSNHKSNPTQTGVAASNMKKVEAFVVGQGKLPPETQPGDVSGGNTPTTVTPPTDTPPTGGGGDQPFQTEADALRAAQAISAKITERNKIAMQAKATAVAASTAGAKCNKDLAKAEAGKAEAAATAAEGEMPMLQSAVEQLKALSNSNRKKDAADNMVVSARKMLELAKVEAVDARAAADQAETTCVAIAPGVSGGSGLSGGSGNASDNASGAASDAASAGQLPQVTRPVNGSPNPEGDADLQEREREERERQEEERHRQTDAGYVP